MNRKERRAAKSQGKDFAAPAAPTGASTRIAEQFATAFAHHQAGRLAQAEALYRQICAADPNHVESLHFLGVIAAQGGRTDAAVDLIGRALALKRDHADANFNLGNALAKADRLDQAAMHYKRAVALQPDYAEAHFALGVVLLRQGRSVDALPRFERTVALQAPAITTPTTISAAFCRRKAGSMKRCRGSGRRWRSSLDFAQAHHSGGAEP